MEEENPPPRPQAKARVFVSYAREDSKIVERLKRDLEHDGFDVWRDLERIQGGDSIPTEIAEAIKAADFFLVVISASSNKSPWVESEVGSPGTELEFAL